MKVHLLFILLPFLCFPIYHAKKNSKLFLKTEEHLFKKINDATVLYDQMQLDKFGLSQEAFEFAYKGYLGLIQKNILHNCDILTICDFSQSSKKKRFYILDLSGKQVVLNTFVAHGHNSGGEYADQFSNNTNSHKSSLGFYITGSVYYGQHGISMKLKGLETGFNDFAMRRNIIIHGADYVSDQYARNNKFLGRSYGCPAVPVSECKSIIGIIKDGTCLFIYHPTKKYLQHSKILNG